MDPDSTDLNYDFLKQFFEPEPSIMEPSQSVSGYGEHPVQYSGNYSGDEKVKTEKKLKSSIDSWKWRCSEKNKTIKRAKLRNKKLLLDETTSAMDDLKKQKKDLIQKNNDLLSEVSVLEKRLIGTMQGVVDARKETDTLRQSVEIYEKELPINKTKVEQLEAQVFQFTAMKMNREASVIKIAELKNDLDEKVKTEKKLKSSLDSWKWRCSEKNKTIKRAKLRNKKLLNLLTHWGKKLDTAGLLTDNERASIVIEHDAENSISKDIEVEDQNEDMTEQADLGPPRNFEKSRGANEAFPETSTSFLQPVMPNARHNTDGFHFGQSSKTPQGAAQFGRPQPSKSSNYFRKRYQDVLEDPQVSNDCMDISVSELSTMRRELCLDKILFTPISPIPPSPPPKNKASLPGQSKPSCDIDETRGTKAASQSRVLAPTRRQILSRP